MNDTNLDDIPVFKVRPTFGSVLAHVLIVFPATSHLTQLTPHVTTLRANNVGFVTFLDFRSKIVVVQHNEGRLGINAALVDMGPLRVDSLVQFVGEVDATSKVGTGSCFF
jgi:hypothetical protein